MGLRWKKGDYVRLGQAVSQYNKYINKFFPTYGSILPKKVNYKEVKSNIYTRQELNRIISSLHRFTKNEIKIISLQSGQKITSYEYSELKKARKRIENRINKSLEEFERELDVGFSRAQMGSTIYRQLKAQQKNLQKLETSKGYEFYKIKQRIYREGTKDYEYKKAIIYKENYEKVMEKYQDFENYNLLKEYFNSLSNPLDFYNAMNKNELTVDLTYQSDEVFAQNGFNRFLEMLGINIGDEIEII